MNQLLYEIVGWLGFLTRPVVLLQCLSAAAIALGYALWMRPRLKNRRYRDSVLAAVGLWFLLRLNGLVIEWLGYPNGLATYFSQAWAVWVVLTVVRLLLLTRFPAKEIQRLYSRIVQPLFLLVLSGSLVNQLASLRDVAEIPLFPLFGPPLTSGNLFLLLIIPYFLIAFSAIPLVWFGHLVQRMFHFSDGSRDAATLVLRYLVVAVGVLWLFHRVGLNTSAIAAIAGGLSVGIGFGTKEVFSNFISGLWLLFEGSVRPGSVLFIDGDPCEVRSLGLRAAVLWRNRDNAELVIPNQTFFTATTTTYTGSDRLRRSEVQIGAAYRHDPAEVIALLEEVARATEGVLGDPAPRAFLVGYGDSSINYSLRYWIDDPLGNLAIQSAVSQAVWHAFATKGIEIPFPQRVVHQI
ncbi:mechanosensitive ion channel family protein [Synechococcus sp. RedBA-s]|uniref:mechanosensitive ion channel family protein n=1 Tax=Synechococcus sp. RedBA-s TaxID=2823741 RepID=UPI0020CE65C8|nr:mechanosensitive ion channel domain-containing protein [Synechococcus sp. RedBA-s]MCP9800287.1 mechanosensitive ion channel [Synechococcus sp. RedBA-s]